MQKRSLVKIFFLFIITLGIYRLIWVIKTRNEMIEKGQKIPTIWLFLLPYILVIASFSLVVISSISVSKSNVTATYSSGYENCTNEQVYSTKECERLYSNANNSTENTGKNVPLLAGYILFYIIIMLYLPLTALFYWPYCKAVENVTHEKLSFPLAIISFLLVPDGFDFLIIQDSFNKISSSSSLKVT